MKKIYLGALTLAICSASFAQNVKTETLTKVDYGNSGVVKPITSMNMTDDRAFVIWSDDCNNAANWTFNNTSTPALDWYVETSTDLDALTPTPLGPELETFNSATAAGGFLMINSDNAGAGVTVVAQAGITLPAGALTAEPNVKLRFSHAYRWWNDTRGVRISVDGGSNWTDFEITDASGYDLGYSSGLQESGNPQIESIDISAIAGGYVGALMIEFYYDDNADWGWFWAVDDVEVIRTEDNDIAVDNTYFGSVGTIFVPYYMVPDEQIAPITFSALITNIGLVDQTNTSLVVDVNTGETSLSSALMTSVVGVTDSIFTTTDYTPSALGTYTFDITVASTDFVDGDVANNTINSEAIEITDYTYGRDNGTETGAISNVTDNTGLLMSIGNVMNIFADGVIGALDVKISDNADNEGGLIYGAVYVLNAAGDDYDWVSQSVDYTVEAADLDGYVRLVLEDPVSVTDGQEILIVAGHYGDDVSFSYAQPAVVQTVLGYTGDGLFNLTGANVIMIRADFRDFTGVNDEVAYATSVNAYPNPATDNVNINYSISEASEVSVTVTTITGEVVFVNNLGTVSAGEYTENINAANLANGVYFYTLRVNGNDITKKLVISKK